MRKLNKQTAPTTKRSGAPARKARRELVTVIGPLTACTLKDVLWETLNDIRSNQIQAHRGDAIASQAREILRTIKTQMQIANAAKRGLPEDIVRFSEG